MTSLLNVMRVVLSDGPVGNISVPNAVIAVSKTQTRNRLILCSRVEVTIGQSAIPTSLRVSYRRSLYSKSGGGKILAPLPVDTDTRPAKMVGKICRKRAGVFRLLQARPLMSLLPLKIGIRIRRARHAFANERHDIELVIIRDWRCRRWRRRVGRPLDVRKGNAREHLGL